MSKKLYEESNIQAIAQAIRYSNGSEDTYTPADMASEIRSLKKTFQSKTAVANGTIEPDPGYDALSSVVVEVPESVITIEDEGKVVNNGSLVSQTSRNISDNGTYDTTLNNEVVVSVSGGSGGGGAISFLKVYNESTSTVSCAKDGVSATGIDKTNYVIFLIPAAGTWTVTKGSITKNIVVPEYADVAVAFNDLPFSNENDIVLDVATFDPVPSGSGYGPYMPGIWTNKLEELSVNNGVLALTKDVHLAIPLVASTNKPTIYVVIKETKDPNLQVDSVSRLITSWDGEGAYQANYIGKRTDGKLSYGYTYWDPTMIPTSAYQYNVLAFQINVNSTVKAYVNGVKQPDMNNSRICAFRYISGCPSVVNDPFSATAFGGLTEIKYIGFVENGSNYESEETVIANCQYLMNKFGISA